MKRNLTVTLLALVIAALGVWFYVNFERVTEREHVGLRGEAARNPLLALTRLTSRMGLQSRALGSAADLDRLEAGAALVLPRGRAGYTPERALRLRRWVDAGGHLIVEAEAGGRRDEVLSALQVSATAASSKTRGHPASIELPHAERPLRVQMAPAMELADVSHGRNTRHVAKDADGTLLLHLAIGRGHVTVLPSFYFMTNLALGEHDHAQLAWEIVRFVPATRTVAIAPRLERPSILTWLVEEARPALVAAAALLLLWLWRAATRFGPVVPEPLPERRRLLDHLRASGRYMWRAGASARLIAAVRETCLHRIARTRPALMELTPAERSARLAALTGLALREIELAWAGEPDTPAAFTAAVRTLQGIEEKLTRRLDA